MRIVLVQPPRKFWPYTSEGDNYLLQQALPALAGVLIAFAFGTRTVATASENGLRCHSISSSRAFSLP